MPFSNYDQWKTASPYDDEIDWLEEADKWLQENAVLGTIDPDAPGACGDLVRTYQLIEGMRDFIDQNC